MIRRTLRWFLSLVVTLVLSNAAAATVYKCVDDQGHTLYQGAPCAPKQQASKITTLQQPAATQGKRLFWRAERDGRSLYLLGSLHFGAPSLYPLPGQILEAFRRADTLVMELNPRNATPEELQRLVEKYGKYGDGSTLKDHVSPELWQRFEKTAAKLGLKSENLADHRAWYAALNLSLALARQSGYSEEYGIDQFFHSQAQSKEVIALETPEQQFYALASGVEAEEFQLKNALDEIDRGRQALDEIFRAYASGDAGKLDEITQRTLNVSFGGKNLYETLITERNLLMHQKIQELAAGKTLFVVIGAAHLVGTRGLVNLLREEGYRLTQY